MQKIIFLDIDGPMIPSSMFFINNDCSRERVFSPIGLAIVRQLAEKSGAKIVTNSYHNRITRQCQRTAAEALEDLEQDRVVAELTVRDDLVAAGIPLELFHEDWRTVYPFFKTGKLGRLDAINLWMKKNGEADWVAFDDAEFTDDKRLVVIDFDAGITTASYNQAAAMFGIPPVHIF